MKPSALHGLMHCWRLLMHALLLVVLALGLARVPLAYSCVPVLDDSGQTEQQLSSAGGPCHTPGPLIPAPETERDCCLLDIDHGLRGAESGFTVSPLQFQQFAEQPAIPADETAFVNKVAFIKPAIPDIRTSFSPARQPPYLLTLRLRI